MSIDAAFEAAARALMPPEESLGRTKPHGRCSWCGYSAPMRVDGTAGRHPAHRGHRPCFHTCIGTGEPVLEKPSEG